MSRPIEIVAIVQPKPGKADRVQEILTNAAQVVKETEPGILRYHLHREVKGDSPRFIMLEKYADKAALDFHVKSDIGAKVANAFKDEDLVESPMKVIFVKSVGGYASKL
ncbi:hypothetical protein COCC4DRAFT_208164 [Bipolaris maydis ATCC 48331]|uniref:ABM domain-containing protein n=2 Tax=Cochliobolus heterostrophus TaxID=5016 RepID=M2TFB7_COCH5|nr:uncharacterized protein COCC4DRAFT_208164 [Bipolaris maydis ATCC 48331]EMD85199.1 hypothetical protein COCHEDRAFT_1188666 [Bipolaris maydis C5]KAH7564335.1 hypothetical protein BM1_01382 [Bipolaris maydis]ENH99343.1 hypothetical protein COCC4DRAFT_208164 [Bipolaris maydis ATCC 48331]KAJ5026961.1 hypothetical protein J3E73DRAFT_381824 [Bipolaris maydis]KAJ5059290.1 hypothetical protein J3E74DRAFT_465878 [Bipolaris maydis]